MKKDSFATLSAIAILAFILADIGHEVIGHGLGFVLAGGHSGIFTTTRLIESQRLGDRGGDIFDLGGPFGNLLFAALPWMALRLLRDKAPSLRLLLWLIMAFSLFWAFGYLLFCGVVARGDWFALIRTAPNQWLWRIVFIAVGLLLYRVSIRFLASELRWFESSRARRLLLISYVAGGLIACAGAALDPRGPFEILNSGALSSFGAAVGLLQISGRLPPSANGDAEITIKPSAGWITAASAASIFYIFMLGRGIKATF